MPGRVLPSDRQGHAVCCGHSPLSLQYGAIRYFRTDLIQKSIADVAGTSPENIVLNISEKKRRQFGMCVRERARVKGRDATTESHDCQIDFALI